MRLWKLWEFWQMGWIPLVILVCWQKLKGAEGTTAALWLGGAAAIVLCQIVVFYAAWTKEGDE